MQVSVDLELNTNINKICRICFAETNDLKSICNSNTEIQYPGLIKKIRECGGIELREEIGIPILICNKCIENAKIAYKFRLQCQHSETRLQLLHEEFIQRCIRLSHNQQNSTDSTNSSTGSKIVPKLMIDKNTSNEDVYFFDILSQTVKAKTTNKKVEGNSSSSNQLINGLNNRSKGKTNRNKRKYTPRINKCQQCFEVFVSYEALAHHLFDSHGQKYKCLWCPETFDTLKLMKNHKMIHDPRSRRRKQNCSDSSNQSINGTELTEKKKFRSCGEENDDSEFLIEENDVDNSNSLASTANSIDNEDCEIRVQRNDDQDDDAKSNMSASGTKLIESDTSQLHVDKNDGNSKSTSDTEFTDRRENIKSKVCPRKIRLKDFILHRCEICRNKFETIGQLNRHKRDHISRHVCNLCNRAFVSQKMVDKHKKIDHSPNKDEIDKSRICFFCNKVFASSNRCFKHEKKIHWGLKK